MQRNRRRETEERLNEVAKVYITHVEEDKEFNHDEIGFEFTIEQIEVRAIDIKPGLFAHCFDENGHEIDWRGAEAA
ncbi:MAG: hypothetical protein M3Y57_20835 [Acidobacteriota bacterium]|nr:hypothetical protein [Acidobacteriota bacterium]